MVREDFGDHRHARADDAHVHLDLAGRISVSLRRKWEVGDVHEALGADGVPMVVFRLDLADAVVGSDDGSDAGAAGCEFVVQKREGVSWLNLQESGREDRKDTEFLHRGEVQPHNG